MRTVYISGPDVFAPNAKEIGEKYKSICAKHGLRGLYPLDSDVKPDWASGIYRANIDMIRQADIVVANLNPFRGDCVDDGTAFEIGYAVALGKSVYGYISNADSIIHRHGCVAADENGYAYEDFHMPVNLMIGCPTLIIEGNFEDCIKLVLDVSP